jgi:hypothetical protein
MDTETKEKSAFWIKWLYISGSLFILFMIYYAVMLLVAPGREISALNNKYGKKQTETSATDTRILSDSAYISLNREKAFYQSRVLIAESDSIGLALNLADSMAIIEINGVALHKVKVSEIKISKVFSKANEDAVTIMLAIPFTIENDFATILKEPLMIKMAPKDTSEYKPDIIPDTTNSEPVNYRFDMNNGIRLYVCQNTGENDGGRLNRVLFDLTDRFRNFREDLKSIASFRVPDYHPSVRIRMAKSDARIIYRALPKHGQVALFR